MHHPPLVPLPHRAVLRFSGAEVREFLQGVITADARKIAQGAVVYGALLSPQGKMLADFFLHAAGEDVLLETEAARAGDLLARLKIYKLRAKLTIADESAQWHSAATLGETALPAHTIGGTDPRSPGFGMRLLLPVPVSEWAIAHGFSLADFTDYDRARIRAFLPDGSRDYIPERSFPLELGLDHLGAIDFQKGCYIGQEVTNTQKRRLARRKALGVVQGMALPEPGAAIVMDGVEIGEMRSQGYHMGLALLRIEYFGGVAQRSDDHLQAELPVWAMAQ